jgi:hypothetical protein
MPENASRATVLYDQFEDEARVADWGGDDLFTRMPRPRAVDDAPPPRFRPSLIEGGRATDAPPPTALAPGAPPASAPIEREPRPSLTLVAEERFDPSPPGRRTKLITGHPNGAPRPLPMVRADRRRRSRTPAEWIGPKPERMVAWTFALGLLLILIAITTA